MLTNPDSDGAARGGAPPFPAPQTSAPQTSAPQTSAPLKRKIAAIMAADVAGYSRLVAEDEERTLHDLAAAREILDGYVARVGGRIFNTAGDSVMCEFDSAVEAVRVAVDIQAALAGAERLRRLRFRIGITIGDVVERDGDLLGDGVNIASRLESLAPPGGICISRSVHEAVANKIAITFEDIGARRVKNIPQPIHAFVFGPPSVGVATAEPVTVAVDPERRRAQSVRGRATRPSRIRPVLALLAVLILIAAGFALASGSLGLRRVESALQSGTNSGHGQMASASPAQTTVSIPTDPATRGKPLPIQPKTASLPKPTARPTATTRPSLPADAGAANATLSSAGLIADARTLPELYHNARLLETKGDLTGALAAYAAAAPLAGDAIDPLLRYGSALAAKVGPEQARAKLAELAKSAPSRATALAAAAQGEPGTRRTALEATAAANPDYPPASYLLADSYLGRAGGPTLTERRLAFDALDAFLEADKAGDFLDPAMLDNWVETARKRQSEIETFFAGVAARPKAHFARGEAGWIATLATPEPATAIAVRVGDRGEFVPTGDTAEADARTGKPAPNREVRLPASTGRTTLYVTYRDLGGREAGPFPLPFDPAMALVNAEREALERFPDSWVTFRSDLPDLLSYGQLVANRCAISRALIGFGDGAPQEALTLPACDPANTTSSPADARAVVTLPTGTDTVQVQLAYADGSESQVRTFRRP